MPAIDTMLPNRDHGPLPPDSIVVKSGPEVPLVDNPILVLDDDEDTSDKSRIRCPKCGWQPGAGDLWMCRCGCSWNTFDTGGRCPGCGRKWQKTQCLLCGAWSPHEDWYHDDAS